ncbi:MAG: hypothetical protein RI964_834 [Pseudomonadota bacterium]|jgi:Mor family transcriptional regulator
MTAYNHLPRTARELADCIGLSDTLEIMRVYGGQPLRIPRKPSSKLMLAKVISSDALYKLCMTYGGEYISHIPQLDKIDKHRRNHAIFTDHENGKPISALAREYKLCTGRICAILATVRRDKITTNQFRLP